MRLQLELLVPADPCPAALSLVLPVVPHVRGRTGVRAVVSREGAKRPEPAGKAGTPIWVWVVYSLGILAAAIFVFSILFTAGAYILSDDVDVTFDVSTPAIVLWSAVMIGAGGLWVSRRRNK